MRFRIRYALAGGFGGCEHADWEEIEAENFEEAEKEAYRLVVEEYEGYEGMYGLRTIEEIMEEDEVEEGEARDIYNDERESWLDWEVEEIKDKKGEKKA